MTVWRCNKKYSTKDSPCKTPHFYEEDIKTAFIKAINELIASKEHILEDLKLVEDIFDITELNEELQSSINKMNLIKDKIEKLIQDNSRKSQDQNEYLIKYEKLTHSFNTEKETYEKLLNQIEDKESRKLKYDFFIEKFNKLEPLEEFDPILWNIMLEKAVVDKDGNIDFVYANGIQG